jgi:pimeloyl-ACP methyl ester carboxylesterase
MSTVTVREAERVAAANASGRQPVVFIHGLWLLHSSWDAWRGLFEEKGYATVAVDWPDDPATYAEAHAHPEVCAKKSVGQVADHAEDVIRGLDRPRPGHCIRGERSTDGDRGDPRGRPFAGDRLQVGDGGAGSPEVPGEARANA